MVIRVHRRLAPLVFCIRLPASPEHGRDARATRDTMTSRFLPLMTSLLLLASVARRGRPCRPAAAEGIGYYKLVTFPIPDNVVLEVRRDGVHARRGSPWPRGAATSTSSRTPTTDPPNDAEVHPLGDGPARGRSASPTTTRTAGSTRCSAARSRASRTPTTTASADVFETVLRRLGHQRRLPRVRLRLQVRQGRQPVRRALPDRLVHQRSPVPRLVPEDHARRQAAPLRQRHPLARRHRVRRDGDLFYTDNQGPWNGTSALKHLDARARSRATPTATSGTTSARQGGHGPAAAGARRAAAGFTSRRRRSRSTCPPAVLLPHEKVGPVGQRHRRAT